MRTTMVTNTKTCDFKEYVSSRKNLTYLLNADACLDKSQSTIQTIGNSSSGSSADSRKTEIPEERASKHGVKEDAKLMKEDLTNFSSPDLEIRLCKSEQQRLINRAETYVNNISPDPRYYILSSFSNNTLTCLQLSRRNGNIETAYDIKEDTKKRKCYGNMDCYVSPIMTAEKGPCCCLPYGTKLLKPHKKLVELVAEVIYDSPDGFLQVKQIYCALQKKYPYFMFMHKTAINSWKSSIRHALFQKWFFKIKIYIGATKSKCCYWGLNTATAPKEWTMPGLAERTSGFLAQADVLTALTLITRSHTESLDLLSTFESLENETIIGETECENPNDCHQTTNEYNYNAIDMSPSRPSKPVRCPTAPAKVVKHNMLCSLPYEKEYDPVLSSTKPIKAKKRLAMPQKGDKENVLQGTVYESPLKHYELTDNTVQNVRQSSSELQTSWKNTIEETMILPASVSSFSPFDSTQNDENSYMCYQNYMDISDPFHESCNFLAEET